MKSTSRNISTPIADHFPTSHELLPALTFAASSPTLESCRGHRAMPSCNPLSQLHRTARQAHSSPLLIFQHRSRVLRAVPSAASWNSGTYCTSSPVGRTSSHFTSPTRCSPSAATMWKRYASSRRWTDRQGKDQFARAAKVQGLKSRAAFKLLQINDKYRLFKPGMTVIDLGFAPGSWSQVC